VQTVDVSWDPTENFRESKELLSWRQLEDRDNVSVAFPLYEIQSGLIFDAVCAILRRSEPNYCGGQVASMAGRLASQLVAVVLAVVVVAGGRSATG
jgi:hypothetical protein